MRNTITAFLLLACCPLHAANGWFKESQVKRPAIQKTLASLDGPAIIAEWIKLTEIPAPSGLEQARAEYVRAELQKLGLADIRTDEKSNVSAVRKGTGGGPTVVFAAHLDTVFPRTTDLKVKREGDILRGPGIGDDSVNVVALLEVLRAMKRANVKTKGDIVFLASTQEELGLVGAKYWLEHSGYRPDLFVALDAYSNMVWYGALRIDQFKFFYTSPGAHTLFSRGQPSPAHAVAQAIDAMYGIPLPPIVKGLDGGVRLPTLNVGMLGGGTAANAIPREAWFTVDLRSQDSDTQQVLKTRVLTAAQDVADAEHVGLRVEHNAIGDYAKARPKQERLDHPLVQTALATANYFRKSGTPAIVPADLGSTDANIAIGMGIPAVAIGTALGGKPHELEEFSDASSIVPGIKSLFALAVALTTH